jgi:flavin reductase (DIM6/NTAB) family NADH-FMN oxidoreductase RutF
MKKKLTENLLSPLPAVLVGANVSDKPNFLVIGYICPFDFGKYIFFSIYKKRYTRIGIHQNKTFSVNIPSVELLPKVDICGSKSGRDIDKSKIFEVFYGDLKTAPMIKECPITIECSVEHVVDHELNDGVIGRVVQSYVDEDCYSGDRLDFGRVHPILWTTGKDAAYFRLGDRIESEIS